MAGRSLDGVEQEIVEGVAPRGTSGRRWSCGGLPAQRDDQAVRPAALAADALDVGHQSISMGASEQRPAEPAMPSESTATP